MSRTKPGGRLHHAEWAACDRVERRHERLRCAQPANRLESPLPRFQSGNGVDGAIAFDSRGGSLSAGAVARRARRMFPLVAPTSATVMKSSGPDVRQRLHAVPSSHLPLVRGVQPTGPGPTALVRCSDIAGAICLHRSLPVMRPPSCRRVAPPQLGRESHEMLRLEPRFVVGHPPKRLPGQLHRSRAVSGSPRVPAGRRRLR
jgi:hypothetical protein